MAEKEKRILPLKLAPETVLQHLMNDHAMPPPVVDDVTNHGSDLRTTHNRLHQQELRHTRPHKHQIFPPLRGFSPE